MIPNLFVTKNHCDFVLLYNNDHKIKRKSKINGNVQ